MCSLQSIGYIATKHVSSTEIVQHDKKQLLKVPG